MHILTLYSKHLLGLIVLSFAFYAIHISMEIFNFQLGNILALLLHLPL